MNIKQIKSILKKKIKHNIILIKRILYGFIIILICILLAFILTPSKAAQERLKNQEILRIFDNIKEIGDEIATSFEDKSEYYDKERDKIFQKAKNNFETAQNEVERYKYAQEYNKMIIQLEEYMDEKRYTKIEDNMLFHQLEDKINSIQ